MKAAATAGWMTEMKKTVRRKTKEEKKDMR